MKLFSLIVLLVKKPYMWILLLISKLSTWIRRQWNPDLLVLKGPYEVDRSRDLGSGTYGIVWIGRNIETNHEVAVKKVKVNELTKKFVERELELLSKCNHSNIIRLLHSEDNNDIRYFVMEYCVHGNLNTFIKDREISFGLCVKFMLDIAQAVDYLHKLLISHRDIKPSNVLVSEDDGYFLKLADFGLARYFPASSSGIPASLNTGTIGWMAPEVHDNSTLASRYNRSADVFSLGLLFLALVRHQLGRYLEPWTVNGVFLGPWMRIQNSLRLTFQVPSVGDMRDERIKLIHRMLASCPDQRCRMPDVCRTLQDIPRTEECVTRCVTPHSAAPRSTPRHRTRGCTRGVVCAVSLLVLVLALVAGVYLTGNQGRNVACEDIWSRLDINSLERTLKKNLYGQHLAVEAIVQSFRDHTKSPHPEGPLVLSLHGSQGTGKSYASRLIAEHLYDDGYGSPYVHALKAEKNLLHYRNVSNIRPDDIIGWIRGNMSVCPCSLFIFDKAEHLPVNLLTDIKHSLGYEFTESIFLFESNYGSGEIGNETFEYYKAGRSRESIPLKSMTDLLRVTYEETSTPSMHAWQSVFLHANVISGFAPFLPLERQHLVRCIQRTMPSDGDKVLSLYGHTKASIVELVADKKYEFVTVKSTSFSLFGCHRAQEQRMAVLQELWHSKHL